MKKLLIALALFALCGCPDAKKTLGSPIQKVPPVPKVEDPKLSTEAELAPDEDPEFDLDGKTLKKTAPTKPAAKKTAPAKTTKTF